MAGLDEPHESGGAPIAMPCDRKTAQSCGRHPALVDVVALSNLGHRASRFAGRENDQASGGKGRR